VTQEECRQVLEEMRQVRSLALLRTWFPEAQPSCELAIDCYWRQSPRDVLTLRTLADWDHLLEQVSVGELWLVSYKYSGYPRYDDDWFDVVAPTITAAARLGRVQCRSRGAEFAGVWNVETQSYFVV